MKIHTLKFENAHEKIVFINERVYIDQRPTDGCRAVRVLLTKEE